MNAEVASPGRRARMTDGFQGVKTSTWRRGPAIVVGLVVLLAVGCGGHHDDPLRPALQGVAPDIALTDVNPNSATHNQAVSPRQYLGKVSGWHFGHAT